MVPLSSVSNTFISRARCRASAFSRTAADSFESLELDASCSNTARSMLSTSTSSWHTTDAARRSLLKALAWRAFAALNTLCTALFFTRKAGASGSIMLTETIVKTSMFYAYERVWAHVPWGKVFNKPSLGGKQLSAKFFQGQHYPTTPPIKLRAGSPYPVDREHDD